MKLENFESVFEEQIKKCKDLLITKRVEYTGDTDVLENFKKGAELQGITNEQCLFGYLTKHLVSIGDMVKDPHAHSIEKWEEKLTDALNYLFLLRAVVRETKDIECKVCESDTILKRKWRVDF